MKGNQGGHGGARRGAGRPKGSTNKLTRAMREQASASGLLPHEFLLKVVRADVLIDDVIVTPAGVEKIKRSPTMDERIRAATAAAPFYAPKLAQVQSTVAVSPFGESLRDFMARLHSDGGGKAQVVAPRQGSQGPRLVTHEGKPT